MTKPSPRVAKRDAIDAARDVSSDKLAELESHKGGESAGGNAIDALGDGDPAEDAPQPIASEAAAFDDKGLTRCSKVPRPSTRPWAGALATKCN